MVLEITRIQPVCGCIVVHTKMRRAYFLMPKGKM